MSETSNVNRLIERLPMNERRRLQQSGEVVDLDSGDMLGEVDQDIQFVYFPYDGFISLVASVGGHPPMQIALVGNEGMLGASLMLGVNTLPMCAVVRGAGTALRVDAPAFRSCVRDSACLQLTLNRYLYVLTTQSSHSTACTHFHEVEARLARWLLVIQDCAQSDQFRLTHQFLADMLGVQRSAVTIAAGALKNQRLISYSRGDITVIDRKGLEAASCECYGVVSNDYEKLLGSATFE